MNTFQGMTIKELIEKAVEMGIKDIHELDYTELQKRGAIAGFEKCRNLGSLEQFEAELEKCERKHIRLRSQKHKEGEQSLDEYWEHRWYTIQIEHVYQLMCAAYIINKLPGYQRLGDPYMSAIMQYAKIVGVKDE